MKSEILRSCRAVFLALFLTLPILAFPALGQETVADQTQEPAADQVQDAPSSADPQLQAALDHLTRAILFKQRGDSDSAVTEFLRAVDTHPDVTHYNDDGIILEIINRYRSSAQQSAPSGALNSQPNAQVQGLTLRINELEQQIEALEKEKSEAADQWEEKEKEYEDRIKELTDELDKADHMRSVYKSRWLKSKD